MRRRWRLLIILALLLLVGASLLHPAVHWQLIGWYRGEAFYQGMPASWWAGEAEARYHVQPVPPSMDEDDLTLWVIERSSLWDELCGYMPGAPEVKVTYVYNNKPLLNRDPAALPVLLTLLKEPSPKVRLVAVGGLMWQDKDQPDVRSALHSAAQDPDKRVRHEAEAALRVWSFTTRDDRAK